MCWSSNLMRCNARRWMKYGFNTPMVAILPCAYEIPELIWILHLTISGWWSLINWIASMKNDIINSSWKMRWITGTQLLLNFKYFLLKSYTVFARGCNFVYYIISTFCVRFFFVNKCSGEHRFCCCLYGILKIYYKMFMDLNCLVSAIYMCSFFFFSLLNVELCSKFKTNRLFFIFEYRKGVQRSLTSILSHSFFYSISVFVMNIIIHQNKLYENMTTIVIQFGKRFSLTYRARNIFKFQLNNDTRARGMRQYKRREWLWQLNGEREQVNEINT